MCCKKRKIGHELRTLDFLVYLSGQDKIKPPTGSGRRERISVNHNKFIIGIDFFFSF